MIYFDLKKQVAKSRPVSYKLGKYEVPVRSGLAVTPAKMLELASKGVPVSLSNASNVVDGSDKLSFDVPLNELRGIDVAVLWEEQQRVKEKMRSGSLKDRKLSSAMSNLSKSE